MEREWGKREEANQLENSLSGSMETYLFSHSCRVKGVRREGRKVERGRKRREGRIAIRLFDLSNFSSSSTNPSVFLDQVGKQKYDYFNLLTSTVTSLEPEVPLVETIPAFLTLSSTHLLTSNIPFSSTSDLTITVKVTTVAGVVVEVLEREGDVEEAVEETSCQTWGASIERTRG